MAASARWSLGGVELQEGALGVLEGALTSPNSPCKLRGAAPHPTVTGESEVEVVREIHRFTYYKKVWVRRDICIKPRPFQPV